ncbi:hypothetical protein KUCAC02_016903 [Chaenocephalus aceratus]|nr:hypothetical protein KUCAC02_016903 [Chaenocephalus aceratus]
MSKLRPRQCVLEKGSSGYGFHLHGEKGKTGQFIRLVEPDTPASAAGLLAGDLLAFVNGESVEGESHQQVVARIRATAEALELIVVDSETAELLNKQNLQCRKEFVTEGIPLPGGDSDSEHGDTQSNGTPRECTPAPPDNGDAASERSERLSVSSSTKVNGVSVKDMQHSEVVAAIKAGGEETSLLVVDAETEEFFKMCDVLPTEEHLSGALPEPKRAAEEVAAEVKPKVSVSSSASSASSNASLQGPGQQRAPSPAPRPG